VPRSSCCLGYAPAAVHVIDIAENGLVELVRDFRSRPETLVTGELRLLRSTTAARPQSGCCNLRNPTTWFFISRPTSTFDLKKTYHRSRRCLNTNVVKANRFLNWLVQYGHDKKCFAVSTDKAANPTSLMAQANASWNMYCFPKSVGAPHVTSTRFANVAFSNGSLLQGFLFRLARRQPIAVPREVRRYFVSPKEAAEICLLSAAIAPHGNITFPNLDPSEHLRPLVDMLCLCWNY